jgi:flagellar motor switch protein FliN/FliY
MLSAAGPDERALFDELAERFAAAVENMGGERPLHSWDPLPAAPADAALCWRQAMTPLPGAVWLAAGAEEWPAAARLVLQSVGIQDPDAAECRSTYLEITGQTLTSLSQALASRLEREVALGDGGETQDIPGNARWAEIHVKLREASFSVAAGIEEALLEALALPLPASAPALQQPLAVATRPAGSVDSHTFDLLLDVELPVSVSFGRAQIPLKDVLKLATGSIVELNRSVVEPVEIIVNNCVIARGEVVVVEGNFGVRVQEVISRQERLRTLQ